LTASWSGVATVYFNTTIPEWQGQPVYLIHGNFQVASSTANATGYVSFLYTGLNDTFNVTNTTKVIEVNTSNLMFTVNASDQLNFTSNLTGTLTWQVNKINQTTTTDGFNWIVPAQDIELWNDIYEINANNGTNYVEWVVTTLPLSQAPELFESFSDGKYTSRTVTDMWGRPLINWSYYNTTFDGRSYNAKSMNNSYLNKKFLEGQIGTDINIWSLMNITYGTFVFYYQYPNGSTLATNPIDNQYIIFSNNSTTLPNYSKFYHADDEHIGIIQQNSTLLYPDTYRDTGSTYSNLGCMTDNCEGNAIGLGEQWHKVVIIHENTTGMWLIWNGVDNLTYPSFISESIQPIKTLFDVGNINSIRIGAYDDGTRLFTQNIDDIMYWNGTYIYPTANITYNSTDIIINQSLNIQNPLNLSTLNSNVNNTSVMQYFTNNRTAMVYVPNVLFNFGGSIKMQNESLIFASGKVNNLTLRGGYYVFDNSTINSVGNKHIELKMSDSNSIRNRTIVNKLWIDIVNNSDLENVRFALTNSVNTIVSHLNISDSTLNISKNGAASGLQLSTSVNNNASFSVDDTFKNVILKANQSDDQSVQSQGTYRSQGSTVPYFYNCRFGNHFSIRVQQGNIGRLVNCNIANLTLFQPDPGIGGSENIAYYTDIFVTDSFGTPINNATITISSLTPQNDTITTLSNPYSYLSWARFTNPDGNFKITTIDNDEEMSTFHTDISGHTPLPTFDNNSIVLTNFINNQSGNHTYIYNVTVNDSRYVYSNINTTINSTGYISPNQPVASATISPNSSWYRSNPNTYQNTTTIQLPPATNWSILPNTTITVNASSDKNLTASWSGTAQVYFNTTIPGWQGQTLALRHNNVQVALAAADNITGFVSFLYIGINDTFNVTIPDAQISFPKDTYIDQSNPTTNYGSGQYLFVRSRLNQNIRIIKGYNISGIPSDANITSAILPLYYFNNSGNPVGRTYQAIAIWPNRSNWDEYSASWNNYTYTDAWTTPGGDGFPNLTSTVVMPASFGWVNFSVLNAVNYFRNAGVNASFGIKDATEGDLPQKQAGFYSREGLYSSDLVITYTLKKNISSANTSVTWERLAADVNIPGNRTANSTAQWINSSRIDLIFRGWMVYGGVMPNTCSQFIDPQTISDCNNASYSYEYLQNYTAAIHSLNSNTIIIGGTTAGLFDRTTYDPVLNVTMYYPQTYDMAFDPQKYGSNYTKAQFQCIWGKARLWVSPSIDCINHPELYDPSNVTGYYPDINNATIRQYLLDISEKQIDSGVDGMFIDFLFLQSDIVALLNQANVSSEYVNESFVNASTLVDNIHTYSPSTSVGSWYTTLNYLPYPFPKLDYVVGTPYTTDILNNTNNYTQWNNTKKLIRNETNAPIIISMDFSESSGSPIGVFVNNLTYQQRINVLRSENTFFTNLSMIYSFPVVISNTGNNTTILAYGTYKEFDAFAPEFQLNRVIQQLTLAKYGTYININDSAINPNTAVGTNYINNTWNIPNGTDINYSMFKYSNGTILANVTFPITYLNRTGLPFNYQQNISAQTVDNYGNINQTKVWFNTTTATSIPINITSWSNNFTNNQSLTFVANFSTINFNITTNITSDLTNWTVNGVDQANNFNNISIPFTINGTYYINVTAYNSTYLTSDSKSWKVILPTYNISGYVKDILNNPLQGATVSCSGCHTVKYSTTDQNGLYKLGGMNHAFNSTVNASMSGYTSQSMLVNSTGEDITNLNFTLKEIIYPYSNATGSIIPWNSTASWSEPNNGSNISILTGSGITEVFVTLDARVNTTNAFLYARIKEDGNEIARYNITSSTYELTTSFIVNNTDNPGTHYYSLELSSSNKTKTIIYKWSMYVRSDSGTVVMSNDNVTAVRSLDTSYINSNSRSLEIFVTAKAQITADNGSAVFFGNSTTGQLSGNTGIEHGLLNETVTKQIAFIVAPNSEYTVNSSVSNGSVTLEDWREIVI
jgi:hypothetical protein